MPEPQKRKSEPKTFDSVQLKTTEISNGDVILALVRAGGRSAESINAISLQSPKPTFLLTRSPSSVVVPRQIKTRILELSIE